MKSIPTALQAHYDTGATTLAHGLWIKRPDGTEYGFVSSDQPITIDVSGWADSTETTLVFDAAYGLDISSIETTAGLEVDNLELIALDDGTVYQRDEILQGLWKNSRYRVFRYNTQATTEAADVEVLARGFFGQVLLNRNTIRIEMRGLTQLLQQPVGSVSTPTCRAQFGDALCTLDAATYTASYTVSSVTDAHTFIASAAAEADGYYAEGLLTWTAGANLGTTHKVRAFAAGGTFTLSLDLLNAAQVGDTFDVIAGCQKRLADCRDKFDNVLNFQGEPHRPTTDALLKPVANAA